MNQMVAMTGSIAHEINQPISAILANANAGLRWLGRTTPDVNETRGVLQAIVRETKRMDNIVSGIRTLFKTGAAAGVSVDLNELIREVLAIAQTEHWNSQIEVHTSLVENLPFVSADRVHLQQVILNLITNAIDAMETVI
jgi:C4-dicarboxylate-specific signal transduction histidine kinase